MKFYQLLTLVSGCLLAASCKDSSSSSPADQELIDLGLAPAKSQVSTTSSGNETLSSSARKTWPPTSDDLVSDKTVENFLVVLDDSGSMRGNKMKQAKDALTALADTLDEKHQLGLVLLNGSSVLSLGADNRKAFKSAVKRTRADGGTPLTQATKLAYQLITTQAARQQGYGAYHIIVVTDGESGDGSPMKYVKAMVENTAVQVHVVGFHVDDHEMNDTRYVDYQTAKNTAELIEAFQAVAAETNEFSDPQEFTK